MRSIMLCLLLVALLSAPAFAGLIGPSITIGGPGNFPDVAYSTVSGNYLVVWAGGIGRLVRHDGVMSLPAFQIADAAYGCMYPALAYNATNDEFLVTWDTWARTGTDSIYGQRVRASDGALLGANFPVIHTDGMGRSKVAWSSVSNRYMVVSVAGSGIYAQVLDGPDCADIGPNVFVMPGLYPDVCYGASGDQFLVLCDYWNESYGYIQCQRMDSSGNFLGGAFQAGVNADRPSSAYDSVNNRWMVYYNKHNPAPYGYDQYGQLVNPDGSLYGGEIPIAHTDAFEGDTLYGGHVCYVAPARRFVAGFQWYIGEIGGCGGQETDSVGNLVGPEFMYMSGMAGGIDNAADPVHNRMMQVMFDQVTGSPIRGQIYAPSLSPASNFTATGQTGSILLSWTNPTEVHFTGVKIVYKTTGFPTGPTDGTQVYDGSGTSFLHSGVSGTITYYYCAYAHDIGPNYAASVPNSARPDGYPGSPIIASPAAGSTVTTVTPTIQWNNEIHDSYQVRISQTNDPNTSVNGWDSGTVVSAANSCTTAALRDMTVYYVWVRIRNSVGWGSWSANGHMFMTRSTTDCVFYPADAFPSGSGWTLYDSGVESGPGMSSSIVVDGGSNVFKIIDSSTGRHCKARYSVSNVSFDTGASVAVRMKATGTIVNPGPNAGISNGGVGGMYLSLTTTAIRLVENTGIVRGSYSLTGTAYHKYQLTVQNATIGNNATALWKVYVDGIPRISWTGVGTDDGFDGYMIGASPLTATGTWWIDWAAGRADGAYSPAQWDPTNPELTLVPPPTVTDDGLYTGSLTKLHCSWTAVPGASQYRYCIGSTSGGAELVGWTTVGSVLEVEKTSLVLSQGSTYYFSVQADNGSGGWNESGISDGIAVPMGVSVQGAKSVLNGYSRAIQGKTVTAAFTGYFYIQEPLLPYGIKVLSNTAVTAGQTVNVAGTMSGEGGERAIDATNAKIETSAGTAIPATSMSNLALGGADLNTLALGVVDGVGANNLGLLVRSWGKVSNIIGTTYQISDGSQVTVKVQAPDLASVPGDGEFVVVEGISSMDGSRQRFLLAR